MNPNTEYEKFAQEVYQELIKAQGINTIDVQHNIKLAGKSGQKHQIDVYWEYEYAGVKHKVAIECKNYNSAVPIGKVRDFYGVLSDLNNVAGIMVTKVGYQEGAKDFASHYGISLKELRTPNRGEGIIGEIELTINIAKRQRLFLVDEEWAKANNLDFQPYRNYLDSLNSFNWPPRKPDIIWAEATHIPLETTKYSKIRDGKGQVVATFDELESKLSKSFESGSDYTYDFQDAYVDTRWGPIKIKEVKYTHGKEKQTTIFSIDAQEFIKAILKDAISGEIKIIGKNENIR
ncbi:MAG: restriction endonuclease [Prevotella sp.]|jgi:hypothetical protein|nr:restriction endonuclease [Prevotella sp.]